MSEYEITYHIDPQLDEAARDELNSTIDAEIVKESGKVVHGSNILRRKLAYEIDKKQSVFTRVVDIEIEPEYITNIHKSLQKNPSVLRFVILQTPRREDSGAKLMDQLKQSLGKGKPVVKGPAKQVTMQDVEKGIEEALSEEVK